MMECNVSIKPMSNYHLFGCINTGIYVDNCFVRLSVLEGGAGGARGGGRSASPAM